MKIGLISDIHANLEALEAVLNGLQAESVDRIICLGDLVGYNADPEACIERIQSECEVTLAGNHDFGATGKYSTEFFNEAARKALAWTKEKISPEHKQYLENLPLQFVDGDIMGVHASPDEPGHWHYVHSMQDAKEAMKAIPAPICFIGHTHIPGVFTMDPNENVGMEFEPTFYFEPGKKVLINVGSVGQPRDGDPRACYGILNAGEGTYQMKRCSYPIERVQEKMAAEGLPENLILRLAIGK